MQLDQFLQRLELTLMAVNGQQLIPVSTQTEAVGLIALLKASVPGHEYTLSMWPVWGPVVLISPLPKGQQPAAIMSVPVSQPRVEREQVRGLIDELDVRLAVMIAEAMTSE